MVGRQITAASLLLFVGLVHLPLVRSYWCGYDDFHELARTAFEDARSPARVLTTPHDRFKYRPLNRLVNLATYRVAGDTPFVFRARNLAFHLLATGLVFALGVQLIGSGRAAAFGALLFGVHPLAHQSVAGAIWTNTMAHAASLAGLVLVIAAAHRVERRLVLVAAGHLAACVGALTYDSAFAAFALVWVYLVVHTWAGRARAVDRRFVGVCAAWQIGLVGACVALRILFVAEGFTALGDDGPSVAVAARNVALYGALLALPVDPVLANTVAGTPLPSEITLDPARIMVVAAPIALLLGALVIVMRRRLASWFRFDRRKDGASVGFLIAGIVLPLVPVLVLTAHPSETYLYLPVACWALLLALALGRLVARRVAVGAAFALLVLATAATLVRGERVARCGRIAARILVETPRLLSSETRLVVAANVPGEVATHRYGLYGYRGVDTIGHAAMAARGLTAALQLSQGNEELEGKIVTPEVLRAHCDQASGTTLLGLWVHADGHVDACRASL